MILLVAATQKEVEPLCDGRNIFPIGSNIPLIIKNKEVDLLITGVGAVQTTFHLLKAINTKRYSTIINIGIAGSFNDNIAIGDLVIIKEDVFADYGIDNRGTFVSLFESGLSDLDQTPFTNGALLWPYFDKFNGLISNKLVKGITVSTASGSINRIDEIVTRYSPDVETMEGAAVFYTCLLSDIPFICIRSISNRVESRDSSKWDIPRAVLTLTEETVELIGKI